MSQFRTGLCFAVPLLLCLILAAGASAARAATCQDLDGDGYGSPADATCPAGPEEDCDDGNATVFPGAPAICDGLNNDCLDAHWPTLRTFAASNISTAADRAWSVFAADVDGDGDVDALSASSDDDTIAWHENVAGDGTAWTERVISTAVYGANSVFAADVDGDGDTDALSASLYDDKIAWYENVAGDGTVWAEHVISTAADGASSVFAADVDGDGDTDALLASSDDDTIAWYENKNGRGTVWKDHVISTAADRAVSVFGADVDGDGDKDALSASYYDSKIAWYENENGNGTAWTEHAISTAADGAWAVFGDDVDMDGDTDVLSASVNDDTIAWYENVAGDGTVWTEHLISTAADGASSVFAADVDGDGDTDALSASLYDDKIAWYSQGSIEFDDDGDGVRECDGDCDDANPDRYAGALEICDGLDNDCDFIIPPSEADADLDGLMGCEGDCDDAKAHCTTDCTDADLDGWCVPEDCDDSKAGCTIDCTDADLDGWCVPQDCEDASAAVYPGAPQICDGVNNDCGDPDWPTLSTFTARDISTAAYAASSVFAADIDGDGDTDVVSEASTADSVAWYENVAGDGTAWTEHAISTAAYGASSVFATDVDGDGDPDVLSASHGDDKIAWHENIAGDGSTWTEHVISTAADGAILVFAADLDGDGDTDALSASILDDKIAWHENVAGDGSTWAEHVISTTDYLESVFPADVDGDGDTDVLAALPMLDKIAWYENTAGDGSSWTERVISTTVDGGRRIFAADVDGDGDTDALSPSYYDGKIAWHENVAGDGTAWTDHVISTTGDGAESVFAADVDGDGDTDVLSAWYWPAKIAWHENVAGDGSAWADHVISTAVDKAWAVFAADVDGDGDVDALSASIGDDRIAGYSNYDIEFQDDDGDGLSECAGDCDDAAATVYPAAPQICDGLNNDCDHPSWPGLTNTNDGDDDGDTHSECAGDCDDAAPTVYPAAPQICDGLNNDCDHPSWPGLADTTESDDDGDGLSECDGDCYDGNAHCTTDCTDGDGDGVACPGDCDDTDPFLVSVPVEVSGLEAEEISGGVRFTWESQAATAGAGTVYDLFWGLVLSLTSTGGDFSTGACFDEDLADAYLDYLGPDPPPGDALYFMVRGQNACPGGTGTYGTPNRDTTAALSPSPCN